MTCGNLIKHKLQQVVDKLYQYVKIDDFPSEWVITNIDEDDYYASVGY